MPARNVAATIAIATSILVGCGSDDTSREPVSSAPTNAASTFNDADVEFAQGMIAHHEQAVEMAEIALDPAVGASAPVVDLARRIQGAQDPEIELMTTWLTSWGKPVSMDTSGGHDMSTMEGMMSADDMDSLAASTGTQFDEMWLTMMIAHHEGAVTMSQAVGNDGTNADVDALAAQIISAQQGEIAEMNALLGQ